MSDDRFGLRPWFVEHWSHLAPVQAGVILCLLPALATAAQAEVALACTLLPAYLFHQYEEHARGRFVAVFNATVGQGHPVLTPEAACWINVGGVWALFLVSFALARYVDLGFVFLPVMLTLGNGLTHVLTAAIQRRSNPGLWTSLAIFLPLGVGLLIDFCRQVDSAFLYVGVGIAVTVAVHAGIAIYARRRLRLLASNSAPAASPLDLAASLEVQ